MNDPLQEMLTSHDARIVSGRGIRAKLIERLSGPVAYRFVPLEEARDGGPDELDVVGLADRLPSQVREEVAQVTGRVGPAQAVQVDDHRFVSH